MTTAPFYFDWQFWSAVVALLALLLSQLQPLHVLLRRPKLQCEAFSRLHITHKLGNPNAQWHLILENVGGRDIRVKAISLALRRVDDQRFSLQAQNYLRTPDATEAVMLTPFRLKPGEEWAHVLNFFNMYSRDDDKEYRRLESAVRTDILGRKELAQDKEVMCEAATASVELAISFFKRHYKWEAGEYEVELVVDTDFPGANIRKRFRFSLFETEAGELKSYSDGYKFGAGVYWVSPSQPGIVVPIREK